MATKKKSLRERLAQQQENLKRSGPGKFITCKEGITRFRVLPVGEDEDFAIEAVYFYTGLKENMAVISPATFGEKCALMEAYNEMSNSKNSKDREFAKKLKPSRRFLVPCIKYMDDKGKEIDKEAGVKLILLSAGVYNEMIDLFLDDDSGDFTDPINGYDLKIKRTGKGKMDTEYSVLRANPTKLPKLYNKVVNPEKMVREIIPTYKETKAILEQFLNLPPEEEDSKESSSKNSSSKKKKKRDL